MTLEKFYKMLETIGLPIAYYAFPEGEAPKLPFLIYFEMGTDNFAADGIAYHEIKRMSVELYIQRRDLKLEQTIENTFTQNGIFWNKEFTYLDSEKCYEIIYEMEF